MAFPRLPQALNPVGIRAPLTGISPRATAPPYPFPTYTSGNLTTNVTDPLAPHNVLQDLMISALSPTVIAYATDMVSQQGHQQEKENYVILKFTKPYSWG